MIKLGVGALFISGRVEKTVETVEQTSPVAGGIEEVVDGVEEEDEEAEDGEDSIRVDSVPGQHQASSIKQQASSIKVEFGKTS